MRCTPFCFAYSARPSRSTAVDAEPLIQIERGLELRLVVRDVGGRLVMTDEVHAFLLRILGEAFQVDICRCRAADTDRARPRAAARSARCWRTSRDDR